LPRRNDFLFIFPARQIIVNEKEKIAPPPSGGGSGLRTIVLLGVLGVLLCAFAYDYLYAQKQAKKIHDEIFAYCDDSVSTTGASADNKPKLHSPSDIHKLLGEKFNAGKEYKPSKVTVVPPGHLVETYSVMAGAVVKTYDVHVIYTANDPESAKEGRSEARFSTLVLGEFPKGDLVPQAKAPDKNAALPPSPTMGAAAAPGPPGGGGGRPGGNTSSTEKRGAEGKLDGPKLEIEGKEEAKTEEAKKEESKPDGEAKPEAEKKPEGEAKPEAEKKEEPKPEEKPPAAEKPAEEKPASTDNPAEEKPSSEKSAETPSEEKPTEPKG
jgi:hypothetical protein